MITNVEQDPLKIACICLSNQNRFEYKNSILNQKKDNIIFFYLYLKIFGSTCTNA